MTLEQLLFDTRAGETLLTAFERLTNRAVVLSANGRRPIHLALVNAADLADQRYTPTTKPAG